MIELAALVIELRASRNTHLSNHMGRAVQQAGLRLLGESDPDLAQKIHDMTDEKPFTVSPLMRGSSALYGDANVGSPAWIRLTGLRADVAMALVACHDRLKARLNAGERVYIEINRLYWDVSGIFLDNHEWAGCTSYDGLFDQYRLAVPQNRLKLQFASATTFRSNGVNVPLPLPSLVFGSLLSRWQAFTSHQLLEMPYEQVEAFIQHHIMLSQHNIQTALYRGKQGGKEVGFIGQVSFELLRESEHLAKHDPALEKLLSTEYTWMARTINLLTAFALYSAVGRKTTTGMGMVRVI